MDQTEAKKLGHSSSNNIRPTQNKPKKEAKLVRGAQQTQCRTSSATKWKKFTTSAGVPGKRARSSSRWLATPTGQLFVWQMRAMMQPVAIIATVPKPYSSAPKAAITTTSLPLRNPIATI